MTDTSPEPLAKGIGVVIVTFNAADFVTDCLESLLACEQAGLKIVVVDNASSDATMDAIARWAQAPRASVRKDWPFGERRAQHPVPFAQIPAGTMPQTPLGALTVIDSGANRGFAGGVNVGLKALREDPEIDLFWVLNPDTVVEPEAPSAYLEAAGRMGRFGVMGGRVVYLENPDRVQLDGGRLHPLTGLAVAVNMGVGRDSALPADGALDFVSGANMVVSREFLDRAGLMIEDYFLYFEEIDWQLRRGDLPLRLVKEAVVRHHVGASIGSSSTPSPFSLYFTSRNTLKFLRRWAPAKLPAGYAMAIARAIRHSDGTWLQFASMLRGLHQLPPPSAIRGKLPETVWKTIL